MLASMKMITAGLLVLGLGVGVRAQAQSCDGGYAVFFANGMFTTRPEAQEALEHLRSLAASEIRASEFERIQWGLAHNVSEELPLQVAQVLSQYSERGFSDFQSWLREPSFNPSFALVDILASDRFWEQTGFSAIELDDAAVAHQLSLYRLAISQKRKVIVIAHSQGNLYSDIVYSRLTPQEQKHVGIVHVASPAARNLGVHSYRPVTDQYHNFAGDLVIALPSFLNSNPATHSQSANPFRTSSGHHFVNDYLRDPVVGRLIVRDLARHMNGLQGYCGTDISDAHVILGGSIIDLRRATSADVVCSRGRGPGSPLVEGVFDYDFPDNARRDENAARHLRWSYFHHPRSATFMTGSIQISPEAVGTDAWAVSEQTSGGYSVTAFRIVGSVDRGSVRFQMCSARDYRGFIEGFPGYDPSLDRLDVRMIYNEATNPDNINVSRSFSVDRNWPAP